MIIFQNVSAVTAKEKRNRSGVVLSSVSLRIPSNRCIALVGQASHKKVLIDLISGMKLPSAGHIVRKARVSFPVGIVPGIDPSWSLRLNVAHVARLYGQDEGEVIRFMRRVYKRTGSFNRTYGELAQDDRKRFARLLAFSIPFDTYVVADDRMTGDCLALFEARSREAGMIINVNSVKFAKTYCDSALLVEDGRLQLIRNADDVLADVVRRN